MQLRAIPGTDLLVSPLCLGTMTFGTPVAEVDAIHIVQWSLDNGINFLDTANMYEGYARYVGSPGGVAEQILGKALKGRRDQAVLATKVGMKIGPGDDDQGLSCGHIRRELDRSLMRLGCEYVDIYYMHKPDPATPLAESIAAFDGLISAGKVRYWAVSNFPAEQLSKALELCDQNGWRRPVAVQPAYSLLKRDIESDLLPLCQEQQIGVFPYQVLQGGMLTGKYRRGEPAPAGSRRLEKPEWTMALDEQGWSQLESVEADARRCGRSLMQHALRSLLAQPAVVSLVMGVKRIAQLQELIACIE